MIIKTDKRLIPLLKRTFGERIKCIDRDEFVDESEYDFHIAMGSLPRYLRPSLNSFEISKKLKLEVDKKRSKELRDKLIDSRFNKLVGISWKSNSQINSNKSLSLEEFILGIYSPNIRFVCLQYGEVKEEINYVREKHGIEICEVEEVDKFNDIDDLAALISACDEIVSVGNVTVHLSGVLGVNGHILVPINSLFYFGLDDPTSYWYPTLKLFRQKKLGEWSEQLERLKNLISNQVHI